MTGPQPYYEHGGITIYHGDCREILREIDQSGISVVLADPPYSSGGFQEAGRSGGSIGTRSDEVIAMDNLSTRGYQRLMREVLRECNQIENVYLFTDWRMWVYTFDCIEDAGWRVRSMLVWDKGTPGMGTGWRNQNRQPEPPNRKARRFAWARDCELHTRRRTGPIRRKRYDASGGEEPGASGHRDRDRGAVLRDRGQAAQSGSVRFRGERMTGPQPSLWDTIRGHQARSASKHADLIARLAPHFWRMAQEAGASGVTPQEFRVRAEREGWLPTFTEQRGLSFLCAVPKAAGCVAKLDSAGYPMKRMSPIPKNRNPGTVYVLPQYAKEAA